MVKYHTSFFITLTALSVNSLCFESVRFFCAWPSLILLASLSDLGNVTEAMVDWDDPTTGRRVSSGLCDRTAARIDVIRHIDSTNDNLAWHQRKSPVSPPLLD